MFRRASPRTRSRRPVAPRPRATPSRPRARCPKAARIGGKRFHVQSYGPAYRVVTPRLLIRCWTPYDAPKLQAAIDASLGELRRYMPWAQAEPEPIEQKQIRLRQFRGRFDLGEDFVYGIFDP